MRKRIALSATIVAVFGIAAASDSWASGDPRGERNLAKESALPRGEGFAAQFAADAAIGSHRSVIFAEDFEGDRFRERWDEVRDRQNAVLSLADPEDGRSRLGERCLKVVADLRENTGGGLTKWFESRDVLHVRFYVKFAHDCDYVHHFCTLRANRGLRGADRWSGFGGAGKRPEGDDRFSTALEPWGSNRRVPPPGKWNFYSYWHEMKASPDGKYWGNSFQVPQQMPIPKGRWICAEFMLKHNTPGEPDGEQAYWIDGELVGHWKGINWRKSPTLFANSLTLESYVTDRWTRNRINVVYFDNLVIAGEYIGPAGE